MGTLLASFWYSYRNSERIAFRFLYSLGVIPCDSLKTLLKCGTSLNPTAKQISDICFCECFRSSQAVFKRYWVTNCENVIPLHRLKYEQNAERFIPTSAAISSKEMYEHNEAYHKRKFAGTSHITSYLCGFAGKNMIGRSKNKR